MKEVLNQHIDSIYQSNILTELGLTAGQYIVVSAHREENIDHEQHFLSLMNALNQIADKYQLPVIYSAHPRSWKRIEERGFSFHPLIRPLKPFGFFAYNHLQLNAFCVLSDSGTLSEESAILGFPGVLLRTSTERPEVLDKGTVIIGGIAQSSLVQSIALAREMWENEEPVALASDYGDTNISVKVVKLIQSYTPIVQNVIWRKQESS